MRNVGTLAGREWRALFYSPIAYIVGTVFLVLQGFTFWFLVSVLTNPFAVLDVSVIQLFFGATFWFWLGLLLVAPAITMRLLSEEQRSGSLELLLTAPVTPAEVVIAKFLGAFIFYGLLWAPTALYWVLLRQFTVFDLGPILAGYLGILLMGALFLAVGLLASSLTANQVIAAVVSTVVLVLLFSLGFLSYLVTAPALQPFFDYVNILEHFEEFGRGIVDTRHLVFYLSLTLASLWAACQVLESRRWRT